MNCQDRDFVDFVDVREYNKFNGLYRNASSGR
jgi:hypothetical protein